MAVNPRWRLDLVAIVLKPAHGRHLAEQLHRDSEEWDEAGTGERCGSYEQAAVARPVASGHSAYELPAVAFSLGAILFNSPLTTPRPSTTWRTL